MGPRISVAIPNFNYAGFIGETVRSVLDQSVSVAEVHVSDNASTDDSLKVLAAIDDERLSVSSRATNVGFAGNLDHAVRPTTGEFVLLLSSDDLMLPGATATYSALVEALGDDAASTVICSAQYVIDGEGEQIGYLGALDGLWKSAVVDEHLSRVAGGTVTELPTSLLLGRSLRGMRTPLPFASTMYPRALYDRIEGYGASKYINPDKWFHWRVLAQAKRVLFVDRPLFAYRVHNQNQASQQAGSGSLKHLIDEYSYTFDVSDDMLRQASMTRDELVAAFLRHDIVERGVAELAYGSRVQAQRHVRFALATYPAEARRDAGVWALRLGAAAGPLGSSAARLGVRAVRRKDPAVQEWAGSSLRMRLTSVGLRPPRADKDDSGEAAVA